MSKTAIAGMLTERLGLKKSEAMEAVDVVMKGIERVILSHGRITFVGFGSFRMAERRSRKTAENPEPMVKTGITFTPGAALREAIERRHPPKVGPVPRPRRGGRRR